MATAIGVISGVLGIFSFLQNEFTSGSTSDAKFRLSIANNGNNGKQGPSNAGGNAPDVRIWGPTAEFLGIKTNDGSHCGEGDIVCDFKVTGVKQAPDYALFTANNDAICVTSLRTTYPNNNKYSVVIGNYAHTCANKYGVSQATWYYTSNYFQTKNQGSVNVKCAWMDGNGDQPCTGIQVHWPDYDSKTNSYKSENPGTFCNSHPRLFFHKNSNPHTVVYYTSKRDVFAEDPSIATSPHVPRSELEAPSKRTGSSHQFAHKLVKSSLEEQSASYLCTALGAAGPSFVSYEERKFCYMPTKEVFDFCDDAESGACWDDELNLVVPKIFGVHINIPAMNFTDVAAWTEPVFE